MARIVYVSSRYQNYTCESIRRESLLEIVVVNKKVTAEIGM